MRECPRAQPSPASAGKGEGLRAPKLLTRPPSRSRDPRARACVALHVGPLLVMLERLVACHLKLVRGGVGLLEGR